MVNEETKHYVIVGLPNSGKSVYFSVAMDYFQRTFNRKEAGYALTYSELYTDEIVRETMNALRRGEWPQHTQGANYHEVKFNFKNSHGQFVREKLSFVDCGGETFEEIFGGEVDENCLSEEAREVKRKVFQANGIIFVFSAETLKDVENNGLATAMFNLLHYIETSHYTQKLALVITKGDELGEKPPSVKEIKEYFSNQQPSAFARLRMLNCKVRFFVVASVMAEISETGEKIPPINYTSLEDSTNIDEPIVWMLNMEDETDDNWLMAHYNVVATKNNLLENHKKSWWDLLLN